MAWKNLEILKLKNRIEELQDWLIAYDVCIECGGIIGYCGCGGGDDDDCY